MANSFVHAKLMNLNTLRVLVFTDIPRRERTNFYLYKNKQRIKVTIIKSMSSNQVTFFDLLLDEKFEFGYDYSISIEDLGSYPVDISEAIHFKEFDELFNYEEDDLGAIYSPKETRFSLWAPLASEVILRIKEKDGLHSYKCKRSDKGVYRCIVKGDLKNKEYDYLVTNSGVTNKALDPYGKGVGLNSEYSAVVDINEIKNRKKVEPTTVINNYVDAIIYELSVRDFTEECPYIVNKGKYLGLAEENKFDEEGNPVGLEYLKYLGITHVQLQPIIDFRGVDDVNVLKSYNWGYDPISMFSIEGSYASNPGVPQARLLELAQMIDVLHKNDIRVIIDVVFNHVYEYATSTFEKIVPHYFFRNKRNGQVADASGCGNDFASERYMARKIIKDTLRYFVEVFDIDGYRFDLMGLLDKKTLEESFREVKALKQDVMYYGEGWNMGNELKVEERVTHDNAFILPNFAFFNDMYRDVIRGSQGDIAKKGYTNGDITYVNGAEFTLTGCVLPYTYNPRFMSVNQSLNYLECHDDCTLKDKFIFSNRDEDEATILKRIKLANALLLLSFGIPFIHMGQEIGLSKNMHRNTYNVVKINNMDWSIAAKRKDMVKMMKSLIALRKSVNTFHETDNNYLDEHISFFKWHSGVLMYRIIDKEVNGANKELIMVINPTNQSSSFEVNCEGCKVLLSTSSKYKYLDTISKEIEVEPISITIINK